MFTAKRCLSNCVDGQSAVGFYTVFWASHWSFFFSRCLAGSPRELLCCGDSSWGATCGVASCGVTCVAVHVTISPEPTNFFFLKISLLIYVAFTYNYYSYHTWLNKDNLVNIIGVAVAGFNNSNNGNKTRNEYPLL